MHRLITCTTPSSGSARNVIIYATDCYTNVTAVKCHFSMYTVHVGVRACCKGLITLAVTPPPPPSLFLSQRALHLHKTALPKYSLSTAWRRLETGSQEHEQARWPAGTAATSLQ